MSYPAGSRKIDMALTDMRAHLYWLREHRSPPGPDRRPDLTREVGVTECMEMLVRYGAKIIPADDQAAQR